MAIRTCWQDAAHTILVWSIEGSWTWDEFNRHMLAAYQEAQTLKHRYAVICDLTRCTVLPPGIVARAHLAVKYAPTNLGTMVVVGLPPIFEASLRAVRRVHPRLAGDLYTASTVQDALALVARVHSNQAAATRKEALFVPPSPIMNLKKVTGLLKAVC